MVEFDPFDLAVLEIGSGVWFMLSFVLFIVFARHIVAWLKQSGTSYRDPTVQAAAALAVFSAGTALRGLLFWSEFTDIHRNEETHLWADTWPWFILSVYLNVLGAAWGVWVFSPDKWRAPVSIATVLFSVVFPVWLFLSISLA